MPRLFLTTLAVACLSFPWYKLTAGDHTISIVVRGSYTSTSKVFANLDAALPFERDQYISFDHIIGAGFELRYHWLEQNLFFSLSADLLSTTTDQVRTIAFSGQARQIPMQEGFRLIPVELGVHAFIPVGGERIKISMGGGVGLYYGERFLSVAGVDAVMQNIPIGYGIHIRTAMEYRLHPGVWLQGGMTFRDPEFTAVNQFEEQSTEYNGTFVNFPRREFNTRVNINGINLMLGMVVELL